MLRDAGRLPGHSHTCSQVPMHQPAIFHLNFQHASHPGSRNCLQEDSRDRTFAWSLWPTYSSGGRDRARPHRGQIWPDGWTNWQRRLWKPAASFLQPPPKPYCWFEGRQPSIITQLAGFRPGVFLAGFFMVRFPTGVRMQGPWHSRVTGAICFSTRQDSSFQESGAHHSLL